MRSKAAFTSPTYAKVGGHKSLIPFDTPSIDQVYSTRYAIKSHRVWTKAPNKQSWLVTRFAAGAGQKFVRLA
ncbi:unnamed protein product [Tenebrio molitor]|nr:unnamed protein product [Tenebrio molitor]